MVDYPNKRELELQERFISVIERLQAVPKHLWIWLALSLVAALPLAYVLRVGLYTLFAGAYRPPEIAYIAPTPASIEILSQGFLTAGEGSYAAYARIKNPNSELAVRTLGVQFAIENQAGQVIATHALESYLLPGQDRVFVMPSKFLQETPAVAKVEFEISHWSRTEIPILPTFFFENPQTGSDPAIGFFASALYRNESAYHISAVDLTALAYDLEGRLISANTTVISDVLARESRFFRLIWPAGIGNSVSRVEFQASINVLKAGTLTIEGPQFDESDPR